MEHAIHQYLRDGSYSDSYTKTDKQPLLMERDSKQCEGLVIEDTCRRPRILP